MSAYYCLLGSTPDLSWWEVQQVAAQFDADAGRLNDRTAQVNLPDDQSAIDFFNRLGGSIKIAKNLTALDSKASSNDIYQAIVDVFESDNKITFGLAEIGRDHLEKLEPAELKPMLQQIHSNVRFITGSRHGLSAAVLLHKKVTEFMVINTDHEVIIGQTIAVQDIDTWSDRDRGKPYADRKKGMLPPKIARVMINLLSTTPNENLVIYDPFCGTGTVLLEAALLGYATLGSDQDTDAVLGTQRNINWFTEQYQPAVKPIVAAADVTKATPLKHVPQVNAIVTEPFLGKPNPKPQQVPNIMRGLEKLYLGAFKHWTSFLQPGAEVVIVLPEIITPSRNHSLENFVDKLSKLGYTSDSGFVRYARPNATVQRQIWKLVYQPTS